LALSALLLAGCSVTSGADPDGLPDCTRLFQRYDQIKATMSTPSGHSDRMAIPLALQPAVQDLQRSKCLTMSDELDLTATLPAVTDGGAMIEPVWLHAGVVTSQGDEAEALAFFAAQGVPARSIGAAGLGRRIYLGPFATEERLAGAAALARAAGFDSPYPAEF